MPRSTASYLSRARAALAAQGSASAPDAASALPPSSVAAAQFLVAHQIKPTRVRVQVLETLHEQTPVDGLMSAEDIYRAVLLRGEQIILPTIYNVLSMLADLALIERYRPGEGPALFSPRRDERFAALLVCADCGHARPLRDDALRQRLNALAHDNGFSLTEPAVVLRGRCAGCETARHRLS